MKNNFPFSLLRNQANQTNRDHRKPLAYLAPSNYTVARSSSNFILNLIFPPSCAVCNTRLSHRALCQHFDALCDKCDPQILDAFPWDAEEKMGICSLCQSPTNMLIAPTQLCLPCVLDPPPYRSLTSSWWLNKKTRELISALKYRKQFILAKYLANKIVFAIQEKTLSNPNNFLLVPLPSSPQIIRHRGFSHTALIVKAVSKLTNIDYSLTALNSVQIRQRQTGLILRERRKNIEGAFQASSKKVRGKSIILLDDVVTSGSSINCAAKTLIKNEANSVDVVTLARSRHFLRYRHVLALKLDRAGKTR